MTSHRYGSDDWLKDGNVEVENPMGDGEVLTQQTSVPELEGEATSDLPEHFHNTGYSSRSKRKVIYGLIGIAVLGIAIGVVVAMNGGGDSSPRASPSGGVSSPSAPSAAPPGTAAPTITNEIRNVIVGAARQGGAEFADAESYQSQALAWVMSQDLPAPEIPTLTMQEQALQLYGLACIYFSTYAARNTFTDHHYGEDSEIPGWYQDDGWLDSASGYCAWFGITCDDDYRVMEIELNSNGLSGSFPAETAYLKDSLTKLELFQNVIHNYGEEGNAWLGELVNLEYLYYALTSFEYDGIPSQIGLLTNLIEYDCSYTLYAGSIPQGVWGGLTNLEYMVVDGNAYNSTLPDDLLTLPKLEFLYAVDCFLEGDLEFLPNMQAIEEIWVDNNPQIKGTLPTEIANVESLRGFSVTNCDITGTIPTEIGLLTNLEQIWLYGNELRGTIPTEFGDLNKLKTLGLQGNDLTGEMPSQICSIMSPFGRLNELSADCDSTITCEDTCCTCCGVDCA